MLNKKVAAPYPNFIYEDKTNNEKPSKYMFKNLQLANKLNKLLIRLKNQNTQCFAPRH